MKKIFGLLSSAILATLLAIAVVAYAAPGGATVSTPDDKGVYPEPSPGNINVVSGHIYKSDLTTEQPTYHWAGIYGNVSGKLILGDSDSNKMFEWDANATYVFFDNDNTVSNWNGLSAATCSDVHGAFNFLVGASDDCTRTFTITNYDPSFKSIQDSISSTIAVKTYDGETPQDQYWETFVVKDGTDVMFVGKVVPGHHTAYNGEDARYQVILPENGNNGDTTATTYYVWVELY